MAPSWGPCLAEPRGPANLQPLLGTWPSASQAAFCWPTSSFHLEFFYYKLRSQGHALEDPGLNTGNIPTLWPLP